MSKGEIENKLLDGLREQLKFPMKSDCNELLKYCILDED